MGKRDDFMENLKMVNVHLMILLEDIKYPIGEEEQRLLEGAYKITNYLQTKEMQKDIDAVVTHILSTESEVGSDGGADECV